MSSRIAGWVLCVLLCPAAALAEQKQQLGPYEVHYVVVPSTFFSPAIAERYDIVRGRDRGLMNISILENGRPVRGELDGVAVNLLEQRTVLEFREVREGDAVYYLAPVRYTDRETLRFRITIRSADGVDRVLAFQQQMFWEDR
jgi:hypothetical protein